MIYQAPYILPVDSKPLLNGAVVVDEQGRISAVGPQQSIRSTYPSQAVVDFPQHILMPGLVNCHTHLELSALAHKIPAGLTFGDWLRAIIKVRLDWAKAAGDNLQEEIGASVRQGIKRLIATGTTCVGDISSAGGVSKQLLEEAGLRGIVFLEAIGFQTAQAPAVMAQLEARLSALAPDNRVKAGIAPHAPYSVSPALFRQITLLATSQPDKIFKMSIHIAESPEEQEFLLKGTGAMRRILEWRGSWDEGWQPMEEDCSAVRYLHRLQALTPGLLAVHLNYLQPEDYALLAEQQVQAVTCPGSNRWLGHSNLHLQALSRRGVNLALGTDSLVSNQDLNLFYEMRILAQENPWLDFCEVIKIATLGGAEALGFEKEIGSLAAGKQADMIALAVPACLAADNLAQYVVQEVQEAEVVMVGGRLIEKGF